MSNLKTKKLQRLNYVSRQFDIPRPSPPWSHGRPAPYPGCYYCHCPLCPPGLRRPLRLGPGRLLLYLADPFLNI